MNRHGISMRGAAGGVAGSQVSTYRAEGLGNLFPLPPVASRIERRELMNEDTEILVVDDDIGVRAAIAAVLRRKGYRVALAGNGATALEIAGSRPIGLFILDLDLPDTNGITLCRQIKSQYALATVPVVMCSGQHEEEDLRRAAAAGACGYISKPFSVAALEECIRRAWNQEAVSAFPDAGLKEPVGFFFAPADQAAVPQGRPV